MLSRRIFASCALCMGAFGLRATAVAAESTPPAAALTGVTRKLLQQIDGPADGFTTIVAEVHIQPGVVVPRHIHPGIESTYVVAGGGVLMVKGQPDRTVTAGDGFQVPGYTPHSVHLGDMQTVLAVNYIVEKGKPLVTLVQE